VNSINQHIKTLLSLHDCVIIPDFGGFIADYSPAVLSEGAASIPSKDIMFNRNLTRNDGMLINAIIESSGVDYKRAQKIIVRDIEEMETQLRNGVDIVFEGVGSLRFDESGFLQFQPLPTNDCLLSSFGLKPIALEKLIATKRVSISQEPKTVRVKRHFTLAAAVAVVAFLLFYTTPLTDHSLVNFAGYSPSNDVTLVGLELPTQKLEVEVLPANVDMHPTATDIVSNSTEEVVEQHVVQDNVIDLPVRVQKPLPQNAHHVIVASLASNLTAVEYSSFFKDTYRFDDTQILTGTGRYRISVANFATKREADAFIRSLRLLNKEFKGAWVLTQENI
jgi:hypothetical protein